MAKNTEIATQRTTKSRINEIDFTKLVFGRQFSDHMFIVDYADGEWKTPQIMPFQDLQFNPSMFSIHYGQSIFEGLKAYRFADDSINVFRPEEHAKRFNISAERMCMPEVPEELFLSGLKALLNVDSDWVPKQKGCSLYIRPVMFATDQFLGVAPSQTYKFIIFTSPVSSYYSGQVKVLVEEEYVRAAEGGTGYVKVAGNYAASLLPAKKALEKGYNQILWTDSKEHKYIEECGTMNVMFQLGDTILTPALSTSILSGITRKSVIDLAKKWGYKIEERKVSVEEIVEAHKNGTLNDAFGSGTAATITHISHIGYRGTDFDISTDKPREFSKKAEEYLTKLKTGESEDYMNWMEKMN